MFLKGLFPRGVKSCHCVGMGQPFTRQQILDWSKLKQSADENFKFDEDSRKFSKRVKNTVGKGEIAHYEQFLLFTVFSKGVIVLELCVIVHQKVSLCVNGLKQWSNFRFQRKFS